LDEIGSAPQPRVFKNKQDQQRYYSGYDVDREEERREWQKRLLDNLSYNAKAARLKINTLPAEMTNGQKNVIATTQDQIHRAAIEKEAFSNKVSHDQSNCYAR
jgi:hypothetical protein